MNKILGTFAWPCRAAPLLLFHLSAFGQADALQADEGFELSPFEVTSEGSIGYQARDTLAGTRLRTDLRDVANAVQIINQQFLQDTGVNNAEGLLVYTTNTEVGGIRGNFANTGDSGAPSDTTQRTNPQNNTRVRGLDSADNTRNFFLTHISWDGYNVDRVDIQRGANAVLFGIGSPAGIINTDLIDASFYDSGEVELRLGSYGSYRGSFDLNPVILEDELAIRIAGAYDDEKFRQEPAFEQDERIFLTSRWDPAILQSDAVRTELRFTAETGKIDANRPRILPPGDRITPWFNEVGRQTFEPSTINNNVFDDYVAAGRPATFGAAQRNWDTGELNPNFQPYVSNRGADWFDGPIYIFPDPSSAEFSSAQQGQFVALQDAPEGVSAPFNPWFGIVNYTEYARQAQLPGYEIGAYKNKVLTDRNIFDFYENLLDGPNKYEEEEFDTANISVVQTFMDGLFGFEAVYDWQDYFREHGETISGDGYAIAMDVMENRADGSPNPNLGRPMVGSRGGNNASYGSESETFRITAFTELDLSEILNEESLLTQIVGRHVFTGVYSSNENTERRRQWERFSAADGYVPGEGNSISQASRQVATANYIGRSLTNVNLESGLNLARIQSMRQPISTTIPVWDWTVSNPGGDPTDPSNYRGWIADYPLPIWNAQTGDLDNLYMRGGTVESITETDSRVIVWQGFLFDGHVVPMFSWRKDEQTFRGTGQGNTDGSGIFTDPEWFIPDSETDAGDDRNYNDEGDETTSWGGVVHSPDLINRHLPAGLQLSAFYNTSSNFRPQSGRIDVFGESVPSPTGETKDYGFTVSALDNRIVMKVNWYESSVKNATVNDVLGGTYLVGFSDAWGAMFATRARIANESNSAFQEFNVDFAPDDPNLFLAYQPAPGQSIQEAFAEQQAAVDALLSNPPSAALQQAWSFNIENWSQDPSQWLNVTQPSGLSVVGDTESEGIEFELSAQPTRNWNISLNASKTQATRLNLASNLATFIEERYEFWQGPAGDVRFWNGYYGGETLRSKFEAEFHGNYNLQRLLEGSNVPENREWRFNLITNYSFTEGLLRGINIGGSYRWQDKIVIGYPLNETSDGYDISHPIYGPTETNVDLWVGFERPINASIDWRIQLNVRNAFSNDDLIPITAQPDGSGAAYRIPDQTTWFVTNTFSF